MPAPGKPADPAILRRWVDEAAAAVAARARDPAVPRAERARARALLLETFEGQGDPAHGEGGAGASVEGLASHLRRLERAMLGPPAAVGFRWRLRPLRRLGVLDHALIERLAWPAAHASRLEAAVARFLDVTGRLSGRELRRREAQPEETERTLTEG